MTLRAEIKTTLSFFIITVMVTSVLSVNGAISVSAFKTTEPLSGVQRTSMDSSGDYSTPPRASESLMTTIDQSNNDVVYVADYFNNRVVKFDSSGSVITQWGSQGSADGQFINPQDVGIDSAGFVYVVD